MELQVINHWKNSYLSRDSKTCPLLLPVNCLQQDVPLWLSLLCHRNSILCAMATVVYFFLNKNINLVAFVFTVSFSFNSFCLTMAFLTSPSPQGEAWEWTTHPIAGRKLGVARVVLDQLLHLAPAGGQGHLGRLVEQLVEHVTVALCEVLDVIVKELLLLLTVQEVRETPPMVLSKDLLRVVPWHVHGPHL